MVTSPKRNPPVQRVTTDHNPKWKCESNLLPSVLEINASLATTESWTRSLCGALGIKSLPEGQFQVPPGIDHTIAKEYVLSVLDEDLKARIIGTSGDLVLRDPTILDTMLRVRGIIEIETPIYSRRRAYFALVQEKDETFSSFSYRKRAEARSAEINSMTNSDCMIHGLLRRMRKGPLFTKFCEKRI